MSATAFLYLVCKFSNYFTTIITTCPCFFLTYLKMSLQVKNFMINKTMRSLNVFGKSKAVFTKKTFSFMSKITNILISHKITVTW